MSIMHTVSRVKLQKRFAHCGPASSGHCSRTAEMTENQEKTTFKVTGRGAGPGELSALEEETHKEARRC